MNRPARRDPAGTRPATALILLCLLALWHFTPPPDFDQSDQTVYLSIAYDLRHFGRFTDGTEWGPHQVDPSRQPGMRWGVLYPAFLAGAALLDPGFAAATDCFIQHPEGFACREPAPSVLWTQFAMLAAIYLMLWWMARRLTGTRHVATLAVLLGLATAPLLLRSVNSMMTEIFALFFVVAASAAALQALASRWPAASRRPAAWLFASGASLGLAALTRPAFLYLLLAGALCGLADALWQRQARRGILLTASFLLGGAVVMAPWLTRNALVFGHFSLTHGYDAFILAQRIAFDLMDGPQLATSFLCWLPDGTAMGQALLGHGACARFQLEPLPGTFYWIGNTTFDAATRAAAGGVGHQLTYLITHYVLPHPLWYALVSLSLALRGMWIDHYWGMLCGAACLVLTLRAWRSGDRATLLVTLPAWFMLAFHAAVAVNQPRYNLMLVVPFAIAGSIALNAAWQRCLAAALPAPEGELLS